MPKRTADQVDEGPIDAFFPKIMNKKMRKRPPRSRTNEQATGPETEANVQLHQKPTKDPISKTHVRSLQKRSSEDDLGRNETLLSERRTTETEHLRTFEQKTFARPEQQDDPPPLDEPPPPRAEQAEQILRYDRLALATDLDVEMRSLSADPEEFPVREPEDVIMDEEPGASADAQESVNVRSRSHSPTSRSPRPTTRSKCDHRMKTRDEPPKAQEDLSRVICPVRGCRNKGRKRKKGYTRRSFPAHAFEVHRDVLDESNANYLVLKTKLEELGLAACSSCKNVGARADYQGRCKKCSRDEEKSASRCLPNIHPMKRDLLKSKIRKAHLTRLRIRGRVPKPLCRTLAKVLQVTAQLALNAKTEEEALIAEERWAKVKCVLLNPK